MDLIKLNNPLFRTDSYKYSHAAQVPEGMEKMYSHLTPRDNKYLKRKFPTIGNKSVVFGTQASVKLLKHKWQEYFFNVPWERISETTLDILGPHIGFTGKDMERFKALHDLQYLPLRIKALREGSHVPLNIPILTITNTKKEFHWLPNFLEPHLLGSIYKPMTVATLSLELAKLRNRYVAQTCPDSTSVDFMLHAFDFRGHPTESADSSGSAYTLYTKGTDTIIGIPFSQEMYNTKDPIAYSIPALEHSTATLGIQMYRKALVTYNDITEKELTNEKDAVDVLAEKLGLSLAVVHPAYLAALSVATAMKEGNASEEEIELTVGEIFNLIRLLVDVYPNQTFAYVSDSYDYNRVINTILPAIKNIVLAHNGKLIIRPDSGNPVEVVCGIEGVNVESEMDKEIKTLPLMQVFKRNDNFYKLVRRPQLRDGMYLPFHQLLLNDFIQEVVVDKDENGQYINEPAYRLLGSVAKGSVESLAEIFGTTTNSSAFKQLNPHIGLVYGDGMTYERIETIYKTLTEKSFAVDNICLAAGAWMLSSVTRDDLGFAIKASYAEVNGKGISVYKRPATDLGKASHKGLFSVILNAQGEYELIEEATPEQEAEGELQVIFLDGNVKNEITYEEIVQAVSKL